MKPQIHWLRVFVEGVVIVGSILLAFGLQAGWEGRQERVLETDYVSRLKADLKADTTQYGVALRQFGSKMAVLVDLADSQGLSRLLVDPSETMRRLELSSHTGIWAARSIAIDEMESSGRLVLLRQTRLRVGLEGYYTYDDLLFDVMAEPFGSYGRVLMASLPGGIWEAYRLHPGEVSADELEGGLRTLLAHPDFAGAVNAELAYASAQMRWQIALRDRATTLLSTLAAAYPDA